MMKNIENAIAKKELTSLEGEILNWILSDGFYAETYYSDLEVSDIANGIEKSIPTVKGALGSLTKKEYVYSDNESGYVIIYATNKTYLLDDNQEKWDIEEDMIFY